MKITKFELFIFKAIRRIYWFINGRVSRRLWVRRDLRKWWIIFWHIVTLFLIWLAMLPIMFFMENVSNHINHAVWG